jgi:SAM-dependent methyltransferase
VRLYAELAAWFHLVTPPEDYAVEAARYEALALDACPGARTLLELGAGGGNNASHLKRRFACTLTDISPAMLDVSRALNPECEHLGGDMRTLRLDRVFDLVLVHDAVAYLTTEDDLAACFATAAAHLPPGGALVVAPDCTAETHRPGAESGGEDAPDGRGVRYLEWSHAPAPGATAYDVDFVVVTRTATGISEVAHDRHRCGVFPEATWLRLLGAAGFDAVAHPARPDEPEAPQPMFVGVRRA